MGLQEDNGETMFSKFSKFSVVTDLCGTVINSVRFIAKSLTKLLKMITRKALDVFGVVRLNTPFIIIQIYFLRTGFKAYLRNKRKSFAERGHK